jgi:sec-independent protein translocase protein TatC
MTPEQARDSARDAELEDGRMPFIEHINELRVRLRYAVIALVIGFVACLGFSQEIFVILARPLIEVWSEMSPDNPALGQTSFYFSGLVDPFWTFFSLAFWAGIFLSSPFIFYQIWKFIAPGLYKNERRYGIGFAISSAILFCAGASFCYFMVLPAIYKFLLGYATSNLSKVSSDLGYSYDLADAIALQPLLGMKEYLDFAKKLILGFGLIFELPLFIFVMSLAGMVTHRTLWKFNRWAVLLAFIASAALTPPDIYSQLFMAGPLIVLYNLSIILAFFVTKAKERKARAIDAGERP